MFVKFAVTFSTVGNSANNGIVKMVSKQDLLVPPLSPQECLLENMFTLVGNFDIKNYFTVLGKIFSHLKPLYLLCYRSQEINKT